MYKIIKTRKEEVRKGKTLVHRFCQKLESKEVVVSDIRKLER